MEDLLEMPPRYGIGQQVWVVMKAHRHCITTCDECHGAGTRGGDEACDVCGGRGFTGEYLLTQYENLQYEPLTVAGIHCTGGFFNYYLRNKDSIMGHLDIPQDMICASCKEALESASRKNREE